MVETTLTVRNKVGLHARPAALFVKTAAAFESSIKVRNLTRDGPAADAKSILSVLTLGVEQNYVIAVTAEGADEEKAIAALTRSAIYSLNVTENSPALLEKYAQVKFSPMQRKPACSPTPLLKVPPRVAGRRQ